MKLKFIDFFSGIGGFRLGMEWAEGWKGIANYIYVAILKPKRRNLFAEKILKMMNIGIVHLGQSEYFDFDKDDFYFDIRTPIIPNYEKIDDYEVSLWNEYITEEHKNSLPGGSSGGGYITAYTRTIAAVKKYLEENGESTIVQILENIKTYVKICLGGGYVVKCQKFLRVGKNNKSKMLRLTEQLDELGVGKGDKVYVAVEEIGGKKRIIVEAIK